MPPICRACNAFGVRGALTRAFAPSLAPAAARPLSTSIARPAASDTVEHAAARSHEDPPAPEPQNSLSGARNGSTSPNPGARAQLDPTVNPESLSETLEAHRKANRESIIRRVYDEPVSPLPKGAPQGSRRPAKGFHHVEYNPRQGSKTAAGVDFRALRNTHKLKSQVLDYEPVEIPPPLIKPRLSWPWTAGADPTWTSDERLAYEIQKFHEWIVPTPTEAAARQHVLAATQDIIREVLGQNFSTELFGSERNGIALATSDIDVRLSSVSLDETGRKPPKKKVALANLRGLHRLSQAFRKHPDFQDVAVRHARYPLVSFTHKPSGIDVQIVASNDTQASRAMMQEYLQTYPGLREVFSLMKATLEIRGLSDVYAGGMGSYSLFMLVVASMKLFQRDKLTATLPTHLKDFLSLRKLINFDTHGICLEPSGVFEKRPNVMPPGARPSTRSTPDPDEVARSRHILAVLDEVQPYLLCLQDPADPLNDLGRKTYGIKHQTFLYKRLVVRLGKATREYDAGQTGQNHSLLFHFVGDIESFYHARREKVARCGAKILAADGSNQAAAVSGIDRDGALDSRSEGTDASSDSEVRSGREHTDAATDEPRDAQPSSAGP